MRTFDAPRSCKVPERAGETQTQTQTERERERARQTDRMRERERGRKKERERERERHTKPQCRSVRISGTKESQISGFHSQVAWQADGRSPAVSAMVGKQGHSERDDVLRSSCQRRFCTAPPCSAQACILPCLCLLQTRAASR